MKTIRQVVQAMKLKTESKPNLITVRSGAKKFVLPIEVKMVAEGELLFVAIPSTSGIYKIEGKSIVAIDDTAAGDEIAKALSPARRRRNSRGNRSKVAPALPKEVAEALKSIPQGYKLTFGQDGTPRMVRMRKRRTSKVVS